MSKRIFFVLAFGVVLVLGMVLMGYGSYRPRPKIRVSEEGPALQKFIPGGKTVWQLYEFNFEGSDLGEWVGGEGLHWYHDAKPCGAGNSWRCYEPEYGDSGGYYDAWLQFLDTPEISVGADDQLEFDHKWWVEVFDTTEGGDYGIYGLWDCMGVWASTDGGKTFNFLPENLITEGPLYFPDVVDSGGAGGWICNGWPDTIPAWGSGKNPNWPNCDHSSFDLPTGDVIIRFVFASDWAYSCESYGGDTVQGWFVDNIEVGGVSYEDQMVPSFEQFWEKSTDNWNDLNYSKSSTHSWWMPTDLHWEYPGDSCVGRALVEPLTSPWLWIPDSAKLVWVSIYHDEYVPGAFIGGYPHDYWHMFVRRKQYDDPSPWVEMWHEYDHFYNDTAVVGGEEVRYVDRDPHWRLLTPGYEYNELWEDTCTAYNRSMFAIPDWFADPGDSFQFQLVVHTDNTCGNPEVEDEDPDRGYFFDDFILDAATGYDYNMAIVWRNESERPLPFAVSRGITLPVKTKVWCRYALSNTDTFATIYGDVDPPNFYTGDTVVAAGFPKGAEATKTLVPTFTAQNVDTILTSMDLEIDMESDTYRPDNMLHYNFQITPKYTCLLGYDDHTPLYGKPTSPDEGPAVKYSVHDGCYKETKANDYYLFGVSFNSYDGPDPATQPGHEFTLRIYDNVDPGLPHNPPTTTVMGTELASLTDSTRGDNDWHYVFFDPMVYIPGDTLWVWFEHSDVRGSFPGMSSDGIMIDGERSWEYDAPGDFLTRGEEPSLRGSPEDWMMRARIIPASKRRFITGWVDTATSKGAPVESALVVAEMHTTGPGSAPIRYDYTDASGNYSIECWAGVYDLTASYPDFADGYSTVDVSSGNAVQDFELSPYPAFIRGDADVNGIVSITDYIHMKRVLFDNRYVDYGIVGCADAFDANDDGWVDISDVNHLAKVMYDPSYPQYGVYLPPYPGCGIDPTPDALGCDSFPPCGWSKAIAGQSEIAKSAEMKQDPQDTFKVVAGAVVFPGQGNIVVPVLFSSNTTTMGFSIALNYDRTILKIDTVSTAETAYELAGYDPSPAWDNSQGWLTLGMSKIESGGYISPKTNEPLAYIVLSVDSNAGWPDTTLLELKDELGGGWPINNVLTVDGFSHHPQKIPGLFLLPFHGDVTIDGVLDTTDALLGFNWLYGDTTQPKPLFPPVIDANQDEYWDVSDMVRIIYLSGEEKKPKGAPRDNSNRNEASSSKLGVVDASEGENLKEEVEGKLKANPKITNSNQYGQVKVFPVNSPATPGETLYVALVIYTKSDTVEAVGIDSLYYPSQYLSPIGDTTIFHGVAALADNRRWSFNDSWSGDTLGLYKLGILCSVGGNPEKFFPPNTIQTMAQIAFYIDPSAPDSNFNIWIPDSGAVFSVHHGSPHHLPGDSGSVQVGIPREERPTLPKEFALKQNYPNPFNSTTLIHYALPAVSSQQSAVRLEIFNILGEKVATLADRKQSPGYKVVTWNAKGLASGIYFYRLKAGDFTSIKKMVLLK